MIGAIIFDCDGVLVDSEPASFDLLGEDLARHGLTLGHDELAAHFLGGTIPGAAVKARRLGADLPETWVEDFYERLYARLAEGTPLIPHVEGVIAALDRAGIPYAVGSNGSDRKMQVTLGQHPELLAKLNGRLFSGQALGAPKPAPDLYLHAARALGIEPGRCAVIEDSATGARAAQAAGMCCFGYAPAGGAAALEAEGARVFTDMRELPALLGL
ncbi:HAD-IA family hydrolase [Rhodobacter sp. NSM]|uniref:HAD-IA family hydrolase n=1 Tax=Rhodobacter sp. NSM TaxID=3457501 RepID=UPI003FD2A505